MNMFKENNQLDLYSFENELPEVVRKRLDRTQEKSFYNLVFRNINEFNVTSLIEIDSGCRSAKKTVRCF